MRPDRRRPPRLEPLEPRLPLDGTIAPVWIASDPTNAVAVLLLPPPPPPSVVDPLAPAPGPVLPSYVVDPFAPVDVPPPRP